MGREWRGSIVIGGDGLGMGTVLGERANVFMMVGWRGWLRVEREEMVGFGRGISAEEAVGERVGRREVVEGRKWRGESEMGAYAWR